MVEQGWIPSEVTKMHLQYLVSQGFMTAPELATCHVPKHLASPVLARGHMMACAAFYEQEFGVPSH
jgi:hypothetical protein